MTPAAAPIPLLRTSDLDHAERHLERGEIVRVGRGVYAPTELWRTLPPWDRYLARVHAFALTHPDAVFAAESAAALSGLPIFGEPPLVHVLGDPTSTARVTAGVRLHTAASPREIVDVEGVRVTSLVDTVVDIARSRHPAVSLATADAALRRDSDLSVERFVAVNECRPSSRGRRRARWSLHRADARAQQALESVSRAAIEWLGFEEPELQFRIVEEDGTVEYADFRWLRADALGEADGGLKYDGRFGDPATVYRNEKTREDRMRRRVTSFARWGWPEVIDVSPLRSILFGAGILRIRPESSAPLLSLRAAVSSRPSTQTAW